VPVISHAILTYKKNRYSLPSPSAQLATVPPAIRRSERLDLETGVDERCIANKRRGSPRLAQRASSTGM